jgi:hypothetical protein
MAKGSVESKDGGRIYSKFFEMLINIKVAHLMTTSLAKHKATDNLYDDINGLYDKFLEVYIGKYGRNNFKSAQTIGYKHLTDEEFLEYLKQLIKYFTVDILKILDKTDTDLLSIVDEIKISLNKTVYLLTLR